MRLKDYLGVLKVSEWKISDLNEWDDKIISLAKTYDLDWYPINYEICDYYEMIGHMSYHGLPSHYPHWSYGKSFERTHQMYNMGVEGLPYELIINSDPSIAYLMRENPFYLQVLIMCHCVGHSDFFKNNNIFKNTRPASVTARFRNARNRIQGYIEDPSIGIKKVEKILDAAHAIKFHVDPYDQRLTHHEMKKVYQEKILNDNTDKYDDFDINKIPIEDDYDILAFIHEHGAHLSEWEKDLINIVREESLYFIPQMRTKIMNEGWASFWHYKLMNELDLPQSMHIPFLKSHNQVIRPHLGGINPYHLGFYLFSKLEKEQGLDECFFAREVFHDETMLRQYLTQDDCLDLNLFSYSLKKKNFTVDEISDDDGWKIVREDLIKNIGINSIPRIAISDLQSGVLILIHEHDGRDLELSFAEEVVRHISSLWEGAVKLITIIEDEPWEI